MFWNLKIDILLHFLSFECTLFICLSFWNDWFLLVNIWHLDSRRVKIEKNYLSIFLYNTWQKHESTLLHTYVLSEFLTAFHLQLIFFAKLLEKYVGHIFTLLLAPFASKLVNYSRHSETLNFRKNSKLRTFSFENRDLTVFQHFSKAHCASNKWPIWMQKVPKEA